MFVRITRNGNQASVELGRFQLWVSYETVIAFQVGDRLVVSENRWSNTTARHISQIERESGKDRKERLPRGEFEQELNRVLEGFFGVRKDLDSSCPPEVVADWLEDHGQFDAAEFIRKKNK
jgi:hypothetical protein